MVVMLLLPECHLREFRIRCLIPWPPHGTLSSAKRPTLLIFNAILLGGCSALLLGYPSLGLAVLAAAILPARRGDLLPVIVWGIIFSFIVGIRGVRGPVQAPLALNDGRLLQLGDASLPCLGGTRRRVVPILAILEELGPLFKWVVILFIWWK
jgi:hypothetical protein